MYSIKYANIHRFASATLPTSPSFHKNYSSESIDVQKSELHHAVKCETERSTDNHYKNDRSLDCSSVENCSLDEPTDSASFTHSSSTSNCVAFDHMNECSSTENRSAICTQSSGTNDGDPVDTEATRSGAVVDDDAFSCYLCALCGRGCSTERDLAEHVEITHTGSNTSNVGSVGDNIIDEKPKLSIDHSDEDAAYRQSDIKYNIPPSHCQLSTSLTIGHRSVNDSPPSSPSSLVPAHQQRRRTMDSEFLSSSSAIISQKMRRASDDLTVPSSLYNDVPLFGRSTPTSEGKKAPLGERTHVCPQCNKAFFQKGHLTQHLMIHAGGRPHACHLCPKTFIFKFDLNRHMKIHAERVCTAVKESHDDQMTNKNFNPEAEYKYEKCNIESEYDEKQFSTFRNGDLERGESENCDTPGEKVPDDDLTPENKNDADLVIDEQNTNLATSSTTNCVPASNVLLNENGAGSSNALFNAANTLRNLHLGHLLVPFLDQQLRRYSMNCGSDGHVLADLERYEPWSIINARSQVPSDSDSLVTSKDGVEMTLSGHKTPLSLTDHKTDDMGIASREVLSNASDTLAEKSEIFESTPQRSPCSSHNKIGLCDQCSTLKDELQSCHEKIENLESLVREKQGEIEALKCNVQHVGRLAGSLFKTCTEYETFWMASEREINDNVRTAHKRKAHAMGGMAANIPLKNDQAANEVALSLVKADKERERADGHDGTWVAHPGLVPLATEVFNKMDGPNQVDRPLDDFQYTAKELIACPEGLRTAIGLRRMISVTLGYLEAWLRGTGCVPLYNLMEDAATAEISRAQIWQWLHHSAKLSDGRLVTLELVKQMVDEEKVKWKQQVVHSSTLDEAADLLLQMVATPDFPDFLTLSAYDRIVSKGE